jgi:hypothetical protein
MKMSLLGLWRVLLGSWANPDGVLIGFRLGSGGSRVSGSGVIVGLGLDTSKTWLGHFCNLEFNMI